ncbi:hypothetical protein [Pseudomonas fluorescens]|uniref:hypothetical protein n=1 Tax=Pseudomonas fluorescens TaxID=294 RepID=UPI0002FB95FE|nr:hypothetical protein [Pseudomonas fluorescens]
MFEAGKHHPTTKNVTGSPYLLGKSRMLCALSVDSLCCFGAKNLQAVRKSNSSGAEPERQAIVPALGEVFCAVLVREAAPVDATLSENRVITRFGLDGTQ